MLTFPALLTHEQAAQCARELKAAIKNESSAGQTIIADASALNQFDSSALAVLLECRRQALQQGKEFCVQGLPPRLQQLAGLYGVAALLPVAA